jgi:hypothetical protein
MSILEGSESSDAPVVIILKVLQRELSRICRYRAVCQVPQSLVGPIIYSRYTDILWMPVVYHIIVINQDHPVHGV